METLITHQYTKGRYRIHFIGPPCGPRIERGEPLMQDEWEFLTYEDAEKDRMDLEAYIIRNVTQHKKKK